MRVPTEQVCEMGCGRHCQVMSSPQQPPIAPSPVVALDTGGLEELRADVRALEDILGSVYLYIKWQYVSKQMTTLEKERWADAIDAWSARLNDGDPNESGALAPRWWRDDYVIEADEVAAPASTLRPPYHSEGRVVSPLRRAAFVNDPGVS